jgi:hypothetical protein
MSYEWRDKIKYKLRKLGELKYGSLASKDELVRKLLMIF